jgi:hypothetical protein
MFTHRGMTVFLPVLCVLAIFFSCFQASALVINPTYDITVQTNANATQIEADVGIAITNIETLFTNPITLNIGVYCGTNGANNPFNSADIQLSESYASSVGQTGFGYVQLTNAFWAARKTAAQISAYASLPLADPTLGTNWYVPQCEAKALNVLISPNAPGNDGAIGFSTDPGIVFDFNPTNRAVSGEYDFIACAEHELTEVMGRTTYDMDDSGYYIPFDLFRFTTNGIRSITAEDLDVYFSVNDGATDLEDYNEPYNGGDLQDWESPSTPQNSFDAFAFPGNENYLSYADLIVMNILGYDLSYKAPVQAAQQLNAKTMQITFTNQTGMAFSILMATNPSTSWTTLGTPAETSIRQYQFTDTHATNSARYYDVILH